MYADLEALMDCDDCKNCLVWTWTAFNDEMLDPREYFREQLYTKLDNLHELRDETVPKFQCHINHFIPPNYYKKNKEIMALTTAVPI